MEEIYLYHGTDMENAKKILETGFIFRNNPEHWLGNGIYFFEDKSLAAWWTTNPTKKFGSIVRERALMKCKIVYDEENTLNLKRLKEYNFFCQYYKEYIKEMKCCASVGRMTINKLRCAYCDFFQDLYQYQMFIGTFNQPGQPYLPASYKDFVENVALPYIEVQYCVFDKTIIKDIEIIDIKEEV